MTAAVGQIWPVSPVTCEGGIGKTNQLVIWFDSESAQVFPPNAATITLAGSDGSYATTEFLGETAFAPPPGALNEGDFSRTWAVEMPDGLTSGDFVIEGWMRSSDDAPASTQGFGIVALGLTWNEDSNLIYMASSAFRLSALEAEQQVVFGSQYDGVIVFDEQIFEASVQGWRHLCYQRINGEDIFHYHGTRFYLTQGDGPLPTPRPVTSDAQLVFGAGSSTVTGVGLGQIRASIGAPYGTGTFTPPSVAFFNPSSVSASAAGFALSVGTSFVGGAAQGSINATAAGFNLSVTTSFVGGAAVGEAAGGFGIAPVGFSLTATPVSISPEVFPVNTVNPSVTFQVLIPAVVFTGSATPVSISPSVFAVDTVNSSATLQLLVAPVDFL